MRTSPKPIRSLHEDDPELEDSLDVFILGLGEAVDGLQDTVMAQDWDQLSARAQEFQQRAEALGYPALVEGLADVLDAAAHSDDEGARKAVLELTETAQRVCRGHHSAA